MTVYGSGGRPDEPPVRHGPDRLLLVAGGVGGVLLLVGVLFATGLTPFGPSSEPPPEATAPVVSAPAAPSGSATAAPTATPAAEPTPTGAPSGTLRSVAASLCLEPDGDGDGGDGDGDGGGGVPVRQAACSAAPEQLWRLDRDGDVLTVVNTATGRCLDVSDGSRDNQAPVVLSQCRERDGQRWRAPPNGNGFALISVVSDRCLDVPAAGGEPGLRMQQFDCNGTGAQQWIFNG